MAKRRLSSQVAKPTSQEKGLSDSILRLLKKDVELDAGYNNITLRSGKKVLRYKSEFEISDGEIETLIRAMARELLRLRKELRKISL